MPERSAENPAAERPAENPPAEQSAGKAPTYADQIAKIENSVKELAEQYEKDNSEETRAALARRQDALLHVKNLSKGDPKPRAERAANTARAFVRGIAIK